MDIDVNVVEDMANVLKCMVGSLPFIYLDIPLGANLRKFCTCIMSREVLLYGGRLINSMLNSLPF